MVVSKIPLKINQGATFRKRFIWKTGADVASAVPVILTGYTARMEIRAEVDSPTVLATLTTENGRIVLGAVPGAIDLLIDPVITAGFNFDVGVYDVEVVAGIGGDVTRLFGGSVSVSPEVTRIP
jgi:hypothetical protein